MRTSKRRGGGPPWPVRHGLALLALIAVGQTGAAAGPALPNFHTVAPGIYRGGAPTLEGLKHLRTRGVRTVIDLRISPRQVRRERAQAQALGFQWVNLPMGSDPPTAKQVATLLAALSRAPRQPVFVHCQHGADRTGCMIGIFRVRAQGWTFERAWAEMRRDGFDPRWVRLRDAVRRAVPAPARDVRRPFPHS